MDSDQKLFAIFWVCVATVLIAITVAVTSYNITTEAVQAKVQNPALYQCSLSSVRQATQFCINLSQH